jgi:hypothetical protein
MRKDKKAGAGAGAISVHSPYLYGVFITLTLTEEML